MRSIVRLGLAGLALGASLSYAAEGGAAKTDETTLKATVVQKHEKEESKASNNSPANKSGTVQNPAENAAKDSASHPAAPAADDAASTRTVCTQGQNKRLVEVTFAANEKKLPCQVHYKKETEQPGHDQQIWSANSDLQSCSEKAQEFIEKLKGWGWTCAKG